MLETMNEQEDQHKVVDKLKGILEDGLSLKIQGNVDYLLKLYGNLVP